MEQSNEDDDYDSDIEDFCDKKVQLGVIQTETCSIDAKNSINHSILFRSQNWKSWDGGKVGGMPIWLNPENYPTTLNNDLICLECNNEMIFLLQIYCPLDDIKNAFHRCLYLFICRNAQCVAHGSVKCFRVQLSRENKYYSYEPVEDSNEKSILMSDEEELGNDINVSVLSFCQVCRLTSKLVCSRCRNVYYCSKEHQKMDWKLHQINCNKISKITTTVKCFPEYILNVYEEDLYYNTKNSTVDEVTKFIDSTDAAWGKDPRLTEGGNDEDESLTQNQFNEAAGIQHVDHQYDKFMSRIQKGDPAQVLRYCRWPTSEEIKLYHNGPLQISSSASQSMYSYKVNDKKDIEKSKIAYNPAEQPTHFDSCMRCHICGSERRFEFQVMPQILYYLGIDKATTIKNTVASSSQSSLNDNCVNSEDNIFCNHRHEDIDFGTLDIYTCPNSCDHNNKGKFAFVEEQNTLSV